MAENISPLEGGGVGATGKRAFCYLDFSLVSCVTDLCSLLPAANIEEGTKVTVIGRPWMGAGLKMVDDGDLGKSLISPLGPLLLVGRRWR